MSMPGPAPFGEFTLQQMRRAKAEFGHFQPADDIALGVGNGLAVFARQRFGQLVHVAVQKLDELHQNPWHAFAGWSLPRPAAPWPRLATAWAISSLEANGTFA
jgi:hypothetical protein